MANGTTASEAGRGNVAMKFIDKTGKAREFLAMDVLHVPEIETNLLSVSQLTKRGVEVSFSDSEAFIKQEGTDVAVASLEQGLYRMKESTTVMLTVAGMHNESCRHTWHRRFGHLAYDVIDAINDSSLADGFKLKDCGLNETCECCLESKLPRFPFLSSPKKTTHILELVHTDIMGPVTPATNSGFQYVMTLIDDYSAFTKVYLLQAKSDAAARIKEFVAEMKTQHGQTPKMVRSDNGGEYTSKSLRQFYVKKGILSQYTVPYSP